MKREVIGFGIGIVLLAIALTWAGTIVIEFQGNVSSIKWPARVIVHVNGTDHTYYDTTREEFDAFMECLTSRNLPMWCELCGDVWRRDHVSNVRWRDEGKP